MRSIIALTAAAAVMTIASSAVGQDPVAERQALMKNNGASLGVIVRMVRGGAEFNATAAADAFKQLVANAEKIPTLFPAGSTGGNTKASPKIWTDMAGFQAAAMKLKTDATAGVAAAANGLDAVKVAFGPVGGDCQACHDAYRLP